MTRPRPWPNVAREAGDRAAEEIAAALKELRGVVRGFGRMEEAELVRRIAVALDHCTTALRILEQVGAQTRAR